MSELDEEIQNLNEKLFDAQSVEEVEQLIAQGAQINAKSWTKDTLLHSACNAGNMALVEFCLSKGLKTTEQGSFGRQPLASAVTSTNSSALDIMTLLVEKHGADINHKDDDGCCPIHLACLNTSELPLLEFFLERGAEIESTDKNGMTPFLTACGFAGKGLEMAKVLAQRGADISKIDNKGNTALHLACTSPLGKVDLVKWLVKKGKFDLNARNKDGRTPIMKSAGFGASWDSPLVLEYLLHKGADISVKDNTGGSILHAAVEFGAGDFSTIAFLLEREVDVNAVDNQGMTPIMAHLSRNGARYETLKQLIDKKANLNIRSATGDSLLHILARMAPFHSEDTVGHMIKLITSSGGDAEVKNSNGETPLEYARAAGIERFIAGWTKFSEGTLEDDPDLLPERDPPTERDPSDVEAALADYPDSDIE